MFVMWIGGMKEKMVLQVRTFFPTLGTDKFFAAVERCAYKGRGQ
jgi:hypothetical protein